MKYLFLCVSLLLSVNAADLPHSDEQKAWEQIRARFSSEVTVKKDKAGKLQELSVKSLKNNPKRGSFSLKLNAEGHVSVINANQADFKNEEYKLFAAFTKLSNLALWHNGKYDLSGNNYSDYDGSGTIHLKGLQNLRNIALAGGSLDDEGLKALAQLPHLENLGIWHIHASNTGFAYLANAPKLKGLRMGPNFLAKQNPELLKDLAKNSKITYLKFGETWFTYDQLKNYLSSSSVIKLELGNAIIKQEDFDKIKSEFPKVKISWDGNAPAGKLFKSKKWILNIANKWIPEDVLKMSMDSAK
ncbi:MAG: hypothetical protein NE328_08295 [Lentisphaeraceae bacterium]|nr:hypothetical protein [Lentisphaeraceae bacterium]